MSKVRKAEPKRLQVLFDPTEYSQIQEAAERQGITVAEWVRRTLREARRREPRHRRSRKLDVIRRAAACSHPAPDLPQMLAEIERGYLAGPAS